MLKKHQNKIIDFVTSNNKNNKKRLSSFVFADVGTGKTFTTLALAKKYPKLKFLILVHKLSMIKEWQQEMKIFYNEILDNVILYPYSKKVENIDHDILIIDEIHKLKGMGMNFLNIFRYLDFKKAIFLTATPTDSFEDFSFYYFLGKSQFFQDLRNCKYDLKSGKKVITNWKNIFYKTFSPKTKVISTFDLEGKENKIKTISGFSKNEEQLKNYFRENSIIIKNYDVIEDVDKYTIFDFTPIRKNFGINENWITKIKKEEEQRREKHNEKNFIHLIDYIENNALLKKIKFNKQVLKDAKESIEELKKEEKEIKEKNEFLQSKIYTDHLYSFPNSLLKTSHFL